MKNKQVALLINQFDMHNASTYTLLFNKQWLMWNLAESYPVLITFTEQHQVVVLSNDIRSIATWQYLPKLKLFSIVYSDARTMAFTIKQSNLGEAVLFSSYEDANENWLLLHCPDGIKDTQFTIESYIQQNTTIKNQVQQELVGMFNKRHLWSCGGAFLLFMGILGAANQFNFSIINNMEYSVVGLFLGGIFYVVYSSYNLDKSIKSIRTAQQLSKERILYIPSESEQSNEFYTRMFGFGCLGFMVIMVYLLQFSPFFLY